MPLIIKDAAQEYEDLRCSLICNFFYAGVLAFFLAPLVTQLGLLNKRPTPPGYSQPHGPSPGRMFLPGARVWHGSAQRPPQVGRS